MASLVVAAVETPKTVLTWVSSFATTRWETCLHRTEKTTAVVTEMIALAWAAGFPTAKAYLFRV